MHERGQFTPPRGLAITSLILGLVSVLAFFTIVAAVLGLFAIITGAVALRRIRYGHASGGPMAAAGITFGVIGVVLAVVVAVALGYFISESGLNDLSRCVSSAGRDPVAAQECGKSFDQHFKDRFGPIPTEPGPAP
ncbi:MAG: DUF4190 domain-containing protein [Nocardiaceae bacterium]|nr:DUF4190 domain-containing protein [Nocardiaceae bacterium]